MAREKRMEAPANTPATAGAVAVARGTGRPPRCPYLRSEWAEIRLRPRTERMLDREVKALWRERYEAAVRAGIRPERISALRLDNPFLAADALQVLVNMARRYCVTREIAGRERGVSGQLAGVSVSGKSNSGCFAALSMTSGFFAGASVRSA